MRLILLFGVLDFLTLLAYPIIFAHSILSSFQDRRKKGNYAYSKD